MSGKPLYSMVCGEADNNAIRLEEDGDLAIVAIGLDPMDDSGDAFKASARFRLLPTAALGMGEAMVRWARSAMGKPADENPVADRYQVAAPCFEFVAPARGECCTLCGAHQGLHPDGVIAKPEPDGSSPAASVVPQNEPDITSELHDVFDHVEGLLAAGSAEYATEALTRHGTFSPASAVDRLLVRLDDTLCLLRRGLMAQEDAEGEALLFLVLLQVARKRERAT